MLDSQKIFFENIDTFYDTIISHPDLIDRSSVVTISSTGRDLTIDERRVLFISCWFSISIFNSLEVFLKKRFSELTHKLWLDLNFIWFDELEESIKDLYTSKAIKWFMKYLDAPYHSNLTNAEKRSKIKDFSGLTHHFFSNGTPSIYSFWFKGSNIDYEEIKDTLTAFWIKIDEANDVCKIFGWIFPNYSEMFKKTSKNRHQAAHDWYNHTIDENVLKESLDYVKRMCFYFDISLSIIISQMKEKSSPLSDISFLLNITSNELEVTFKVKKNNKVLKETYNFIYLDAISSKWLYGKQTILNKNSFIEKWLIRKPSKKILLVRDSSKLIMNWFHNM